MTNRGSAPGDTTKFDVGIGNTCILLSLILLMSLTMFICIISAIYQYERDSAIGRIFNPVATPRAFPVFSKMVAHWGDFLITDTMMTIRVSTIISEATRLYMSEVCIHAHITVEPSTVNRHLYTYIVGEDRKVYKNRPNFPDPHSYRPIYVINPCYFESSRLLISKVFLLSSIFEWKPIMTRMVVCTDTLICVTA